jgi:DNA repair protein SbcC/Rad50
MEIKLKWLEMLNFKGAKNKKIEFKQNTTLRGDNATLKTTTVDAIYFCLFGKNANDETKFSVKPFNIFNQTDAGTESVVNLSLLVNGEEIVFTRKVSENWVKKHGETEREYKGDLTAYAINGVDKQKKDYDLEIASIISPELFKLLSNPGEFMRSYPGKKNDKTDWENRREALVNMVGGIELNLIFDGGKHSEVKSIIDSGKSFDIFKSELAAKIKPIKETIAKIPVQLSEKQLDIEKIPVQNWVEIESQITVLSNRVKEIDGQLENALNSYKLDIQKQQETARKIGAKKIELQNVENEAKLEANKGLNEAKKQYSDLQASLKQANEKIIELRESQESTESYLNILIRDRETALNEYKKLKASEFVPDENATICPTCKQILPDAETLAVQLESNFNLDKARKLATNVENGRVIARKIEETKVKIQGFKDDYQVWFAKRDEIDVKLKSFDLTEKPVDFSMNKEWNDLQTEIQELESLNQEIKLPENSELKTEKTEKQTEIVTLQKVLNTKEEIAKHEARILELKDQQRLLSQEVANLEKQQNAVDKFEKAKMEQLEKKVNGLFRTVTFKMFEQQKNGGEKPECIALIDGVPYSDANTAKKINAGVDICNVLQKFHSIKVPIIVDNRESVTKLIEVDTQIINLFKDENYKTLTVE